VVLPVIITSWVGACEVGVTEREVNGAVTISQSPLAPVLFHVCFEAGNSIGSSYPALPIS